MDRRWCCACTAPGTTTSPNCDRSTCGPAPWSQAGIAAPEPLLTLAGENFAQVEIAATGERRWAGLARWVEGELLADVVARETDRAANARHFAQLGAIMAAMHNQATGWTPPPGSTATRSTPTG